MRKIRDAKLETRTARTKLKAGSAHYKIVGPGLSLGYRRLVKGGQWLAREYQGDKSYRVTTLGAADDTVEADGVSVLDFWQALAAAQKTTRPADHVAPGVYRVRDAIADYVAFLERDRKTAGDVGYRARAHILAELGGVVVAKLTAKQIRDWHEALSKTPARLRSRPGADQRTKRNDASDEGQRKRRLSANRCLSILKAALNRAWREGKVSSDEAWRRVSPFRGVEVARVEYFTVVEAQRLINACDGDFRTLVQGALVTGCRYGELCRFVVSDFNPDARTLAVRLTKTGTPRHVVLNAEGAAFFASLCAGRKGGDLMMTCEGAPWLKSMQIRRMREACDRARIVPARGFHQLRHTWASLSIMNGVPLIIVAKHLGHTDTRMVEKHYGHLAQSFVSDAIRNGAPSFGIDAGNVAPLNAQTRKGRR